MSLDHLIAPEIKDDEFYHLISTLACQEELRHVLEIGSSAGGGSTEAFVNGLKTNPHNPKLYCLEVSKGRFRELADRYASCGFVRAYNASSVPVSGFMSEAEVRHFYTANTTRLNQYPLRDVLSWLKEDIRYVSEAAVPSNGIELIKAENGISEFDLVLIDGSAFTGMAELQAVYGSKIIMLDDINDIKCLQAFEVLKSDSQYFLERVNWDLRNGFAIFRKRPLPSNKTLPVHFVTSVLNGHPFIRHHIDVFKQLAVPWTWHIVEGSISPSAEVARGMGGETWRSDSSDRYSPSNDGTSEYLDALASAYPENVRVYRKPPQCFWANRLEMLNAPLRTIAGCSLLVQIGHDELWTAEQLTTLHGAFLEDEQRTAAFFFCHDFVDSERVAFTRTAHGDTPSSEWVRAWRIGEGCHWQEDQQPRLFAPLEKVGSVDLVSINPFSKHETLAMGLVFERYAGAIEMQARLERGRSNREEEVERRWDRLRNEQQFPRQLSEYLPWATSETMVATPTLLGLNPLARQTMDKKWHFRANERTRALPREVVLIRTDLIGDGVLLSSLLPELRRHYPHSRITMVCQDVVEPIWRHSAYLDRVLPFNKDTVLTNQHELQNLIHRIATLQPSVIINTIWSPDVLAHVLSLSVPAETRIALSGDTANISPQEQTKALSLYSVVAESTARHAIELDRYRDLLPAIGREPQTLEVVYSPTQSELERAAIVIREYGFEIDKLIVVVPTAGLTLSLRNYERLDEAVSMSASQLDLQVLVLGSSKDVEIADHLIGQVSGHAVSLAGKTTLREAAALLRYAKVVVGVDTGLMHLAAAQAKPVVVIMGGGHFGRFFPYTAKTKVVTHTMSCFNCNWACHFSKAHCVSDVSPAEVVQSISQSIEEDEERSRFFEESSIAPFAISLIG
jgi:ADP-heptose:LPS heptosyltransferase